MRKTILRVGHIVAKSGIVKQIFLFFIAVQLCACGEDSDKLPENIKAQLMEAVWELSGGNGFNAGFDDSPQKMPDYMRDDVLKFRNNGELWLHEGVLKKSNSTPYSHKLGSWILSNDSLQIHFSNGIKRIWTISNFSSESKTFRVVETMNDAAGMKQTRQSFYSCPFAMDEVNVDKLEVKRSSNKGSYTDKTLRIGERVKVIAPTKKKGWLSIKYNTSNNPKFTSYSGEGYVFGEENLTPLWTIEDESKTSGSTLVEAESIKWKIKFWGFWGVVMYYVIFPFILIFAIIKIPVNLLASWRIVPNWLFVISLYIYSGIILFTVGYWYEDFIPYSNDIGKFWLFFLFIGIVLVIITNKWNERCPKCRSLNHEITDKKEFITRTKETTTETWIDPKGGRHSEKTEKNSTDVEKHYLRKCSDCGYKWWSHEFL